MTDQHQSPLTLNDEELERYSRHLLLDDIGFQGQAAWKRAKVCIIGAGGLGNPLSLYLAAAGVGHLHIIDPDDVEVSNLQRQIAFRTSSLGQSKAEQLQQELQALNPTIKVTAQVSRVTASNAISHLEQGFDLIADCTDTFTVRYLINRACHQLKLPLVSAAAIRFDGLCTLLNHRQDAPCYACLFPEDTFDGAQETCAESGIYSPVLGIMASLQADLVLDFFANPAQSRESSLFRWDGRRRQLAKSALVKDPQCVVCGDSSEKPPKQVVTSDDS